MVSKGDTRSLDSSSYDYICQPFQYILNTNPRGLLWDASFAFCGRSSDGGDEEALFFGTPFTCLNMGFRV